MIQGSVFRRISAPLPAAALPVRPTRPGRTPPINDFIAGRASPNFDRMVGAVASPGLGGRLPHHWRSNPKRLGTNSRITGN